MAFSFAEGVSVHPGPALDNFPGVGGWVGEPHVLCDAYLYLLQFHAGSFGASCLGEMASFDVVWGGFPQATGPGCCRV
jgi:hypothetical protein